MNKEYLQFIADLRHNIIQSRYIAARLVNREQLQLYFKTGKMLSEKIATEKWGAKVIEQIAEDLQKEMPGLKGFSARNLINMRHFYNDYQLVIFTQSTTAQIRDVRNEGELTDEIGQPATGQLEFFWVSASPTTSSFSINARIPKKGSSISSRHQLNFGRLLFWSIILRPIYFPTKASCQTISIKHYRES